MQWPTACTIKPFQMQTSHLLGKLKCLLLSLTSLFPISKAANWVNPLRDSTLMVGSKPCPEILDLYGIFWKCQILKLTVLPMGVYVQTKKMALMRMFLSWFYFDTACHMHVVPLCWQWPLAQLFPAAWAGGMHQWSVCLFTSLWWKLMFLPHLWQRYRRFVKNPHNWSLQS